MNDVSIIEQREIADLQQKYIELQNEMLRMQNQIHVLTMDTTHTHNALHDHEKNRHGWTSLPKKENAINTE